MICIQQWAMHSCGFSSLFSLTLTFPPNLVFYSFFLEILYRHRSLWYSIVAGISYHLHNNPFSGLHTWSWGISSSDAQCSCWLFYAYSFIILTANHLNTCHHLEQHQWPLWLFLEAWSHEYVHTITLQTVHVIAHISIVWLQLWCLDFAVKKEAYYASLMEAALPLFFVLSDNLDTNVKWCEST